MLCQFLASAKGSIGHVTTQCNLPIVVVLLVSGKSLDKKIPDKALKIACNGSEIQQVTLQKLLGVTLDNHLNFTEHIDDLCKKVAQRIAVLKKIQRNLPLAERKLFLML